MTTNASTAMGVVCDYCNLYLKGSFKEFDKVFCEDIILESVLKHKSSSIHTKIKCEGIDLVFKHYQTYLCQNPSDVTLVKVSLKNEEKRISFKCNSAKTPSPCWYTAAKYVNASLSQPIANESAQQNESIKKEKKRTYQLKSKKTHVPFDSAWKYFSKKAHQASNTTSTLSNNRLQKPNVQKIKMHLVVHLTDDTVKKRLFDSTEKISFTVKQITDNEWRISHIANITTLKTRLPALSSRN